MDQTARLTASQALSHPWLLSARETSPVDAAGPDLLPTLRRQFDPKKTFRRAIFTVRAAAALKDGGEKRQQTMRAQSETDRAWVETVEQGKRAAEEESVSSAARVVSFFSLCFP